MGSNRASGRSARARTTVRDAGQGRRLGAAARAAGFGGSRRFAELSAGGESRQLVRIEDARRILARPRPAAGSRGRIVSRGRAVAARAGLSGLLVRRHLVLARADGEPPVGVVESLPELAGVPLPPVLTLSDARVALIAPDAVVKVAISDRERQGLANEVARTDAARSSALGRYVVAWSRLRTEASATYAVFPRVRHRPPTSLAEIDAVLAAALAAQPGTDAPWGETALWRRLDSARGRADVDEIGAEDLLRHALDLGPDRRLPTGTTHGDLHGGNVLLATDGSPVLIDWNRSEPDNPLLLDAVYAAVRQHSRRTGASLARSLESFVDGQLTGPLAEQSATSLGELTPLDAAVLLVLDRVASYSRPRRRYKPWTMAPLQQAVAAVTAQTAPST